MLQNNLIIMPVIGPWEWSVDYYNQTAYILSKKNTVVVMMWEKVCSIYELLRNKKTWSPFVLEKNVLIYHPLHLIPFRRYKFIQKINMILNIYVIHLLIVFKIHREIHKKIIWIFDPLFYPLTIFNRVSWITLYDCVDYMDHDEFKQFETKILQKVSYAFANSHTLCDLHKSVRPNIHWVPQGFRIDDFKYPLSSSVKFSKDKPIIGYVGGINGRLDFKLLISLILNNPQWNFVLWGPLQIKSNQDQNNIAKLFSYKNVIHGESKNKREIPSIIKQFDICIIPYDTNQIFNRYCFPMKFFEYVALNKNIVSSDIFELHYYKKYVYIYNSIIQLNHLINILISNKNYNNCNVKSILNKHSWQQKILTISNYIEQSM